MKNMARRAFLRMLPAAGLAGRVAAEDAAARLAGVSTSGIGHGSGRPPNGVSEDRELMASRVGQALKLAPFRDELMSMLYEEHRWVWALDADLAIKRSFSLQAKITFQRQRNVERALQYELLDDSPYQRRTRLLSRLVRGVFGGAA